MGPRVKFKAAAVRVTAAEPQPQPAASARTLAYSDATAAIFRTALAALAEKLPAEHAALAALLEEGRLHDPVAVEAVLRGGAS
jgi:hypothetical protein